MDVDAPAASSSTSPLTYIEQQETSSPESLKPLFTRIRTAYEKK
jgi:26S proteasome regulatory subunit N9